MQLKVPTYGCQTCRTKSVLPAVAEGTYFYYLATIHAPPRLLRRNSGRAASPEGAV